MNTDFKQLDEAELDQVSGGLILPIPFPPRPLPWPPRLPRIPRLPIYRA